MEELLSTLLERIMAGGPAAGEVFCAAHPQHAAELRRRLEELRSLGLVDGAGAVRPGPARDLPDRIGSHRLVRKLGAGGMGVVYLAHDTELERDVALKALHARFQDSVAVRERFQREARALAQLRHPGIIPVFSVGEVAGTPYFTMEYVPGSTLAQVLRALREAGVAPAHLTSADLDRAVAAARARAGGAAVEASQPRPPAVTWGDSYVAAACRIALRVAEILVHTHAAGILHRDIKPSNILVTAAGDVRLFDFGLAQWTAEESMTLSGDLLGTPSYMAPEQVEGRNALVDARTDVYAVGATLHELLTLQAPFPGHNAAAVLRAIANHDAVPLRQLNPALPRDVETLCQTAMAPERGRRYAGARELADDLRRFLEGRPILARPLGPLGRAVRAARRRPAAAAVALLLLVLFLGVPAGLLVSSMRIQEQASRAREYAALVTDAVIALDVEELGYDARAVDLLRHVAGRVDERLRAFPLEQARLWVRIGSALGELVPGGGDDDWLARGVAALVRELGDDHPEVAQARNYLGNLLQTRGRIHDAEAVYRQALAVARRADRGLCAVALANLAGLLLRTGALEEAERLLAEGLALEPADNERLLLDAHRVQLLLERGARDEAAALADVCVAASARTPGRHLQRIRMLTVAGDVARARGDHPAAEARYDEALAVARASLPRGSDHEVTLLAKLGHLRFATGDLAGAEARYREALTAAEQVFRATPDHAELANLRYCLARTLSERDGPGEAVPLLRRARQAFARNPGVYADSAAGVHLTLGEALLRTGEALAEARTELALARSAFATLAGPAARPTLRATRGLARAEFLAGDGAAAVARCDEVAAADPEPGGGREQGLALRDAGEFLAALGQPELAAARLDAALVRLAGAQHRPSGHEGQLAVGRYLRARVAGAADPVAAAALLAQARAFPGLVDELRRTTVTVTRAELACLAAEGGSADALRAAWAAVAVARPATHSATRPATRPEIRRSGPDR